MDDDNFTVVLRCLFCECPLEGESGQTYVSGDLIRCQNCNEINDYESLLDVAAEEGLTIVQAHLDDHLEKTFGKLVKK
jgi:phage FluMu protein Com